MIDKTNDEAKAKRDSSWTHSKKVCTSWLSLIKVLHYWDTSRFKFHRLTPKRHLIFSLNSGKSLLTYCQEFGGWKDSPPFKILANRVEKAIIFLCFSLKNESRSPSVAHPRTRFII